MLKFPLIIFPLFAVLGSLPACQTLQFYRQAVGGQLEILSKSRPNSEVIQDPKTSPVIRRQLMAVENIREFARDFLSLPGAASYGKYADLGREHVVWVLYAAPEFSVKPKTWHYPAIGELDYRGYFREQETTALAHELKAAGYDVFVGGVDAYSTLGWFHDPVLNTFVSLSDIDLAETIFHELTHRRIFHSGDTAFNECLANTVAEEGVQRWLRHHHRLIDLKKYQEHLLRRREFYREIDHTRHDLEALYASPLSVPVMRERKAAILADLRDHFRKLRRRWGGHGFEAWLHEDPNNGHLISLKIYADQMPALAKHLADCDGDLDLFFKQLARRK